MRPEQNRMWLWGLALAAATGAAVWWASRPAPKPERPPFAGVRGRTTNVTYTQEDPVTGRSLVVKAPVAVLWDGKVGKLFRTPLKPELELTEPQVELFDRRRQSLLAAIAATGVYDAASGRIDLAGLRSLRLGVLELEAERLRVRPTGRIDIPGDYGVKKEGRAVGKGRGFRGDVADFARVGPAGKEVISEKRRSPD